MSTMTSMIRIQKNLDSSWIKRLSNDRWTRLSSRGCESKKTRFATRSGLSSVTPVAASVLTKCTSAPSARSSTAEIVSTSYSLQFGNLAFYWPMSQRTRMTSTVNLPAHPATSCLYLRSSIASRKSWWKAKFRSDILVSRMISAIVAQNIVLLILLKT